VIPVVLCGGSGTRLWPMSRKLLPKQFLPLVSERSLLQDTLERVRALPDCGPPIIISNHEHRFLVAEQAKAIGVTPAVQILEPVGRNTAPAVAVAALHLQAEDPDAVLLVLASDHAIRDLKKFEEAVLSAVRVARQGMLVTFGIKPSSPHTGYGYIEQAEPLSGEKNALRIRKFVEKPNLERAKDYLAAGNFLWNSGMFVFRASSFLKELGKFRPDILAGARAALGGATRDLDFLRLESAAFSACPAESIDHAVMEKTDAGAVVRGDFGWSDVGSWAALWEIGAKDAAGNVARGDVHLSDTRNSYFMAGERLVYGLGVEDLMVVETKDALLIGDRSRAEEVKEIVQQLERQARSEHVSHSRVYRPWGYFESIDQGERFQVKRIMVKPRQALSLQLHNKRAEHWVVVSGRARVTRGEEVFDLRENESTFIPLGTKHRLENCSDEPLYLIEVQSGAYLGEDDIVRFEDRYGRQE
jgi:mannose-1-phosphate guanylyltransferase/mannose-6-phosphate isomerase